MSHEPAAPDDVDFYRQLVERAPDGVIVVRNSHITFANIAASRLLTNGDVRQILGRPLPHVVQTGDRDGLVESLLRWQSGQDSPPLDVRTTADGPSMDIELEGVPLGDDRALIVVHDVSARAKAEAALRESEERLTLAVAGAQEGVWDWNLETGDVVYSPRWKQMLGYDEDEIEPHVGAWQRLLHPDDLPRARDVNERVIAGGRHYEMEVRLRHKDGHYVDVLSRGYPVRQAADGPVVRIVGTHLDLSERKRAEAALRESEERLQLAFAGALEGVWDWNLETDAVVYSPRWKQMLGYEDDEIEPHISAWERLVHPDDRPIADRAHERVSRGEPNYEAEFRIRHKAGHYVHVWSRGFPVRRVAGGPVVRIVGTHFDLTDRKRADAERARAELLTRMVFAQEDERRRIAREMHDQFGEQLTTLGHRVRALKDAVAGNPELSRHVDALEDVARRLDNDVDQLVWELRPTALDDLGLAAALANYVTDWSARVGTPAQVHTAGLQSGRLSSEIETTLYRIAQEALTNVAKHARATAVDVILERRGEQVMLIVEDNGVGFDAGGSAGSRGGFGLVGMRERAALVEATIEIESAVGRGTTIIVRMNTPSTTFPEHA